MCVSNPDCSPPASPELIRPNSRVMGAVRLFGRAIGSLQAQNHCHSYCPIRTPSSALASVPPLGELAPAAIRILPLPNKVAVCKKRGIVRLFVERQVPLFGL